MPVNKKKYLQILGTESNECVFSRGTPTHSRQSLSLELPTPIPASCNVLIYEAEGLVEEPPAEAVLAQVSIHVYLYFIYSLISDQEIVNVVGAHLLMKL